MRYAAELLVRRREGLKENVRRFRAEFTLVSRYKNADKIWRLMPTFAEISNQPNGFRAVPKVSREAVKLLWYSGFWDGPQSGMLVYEGEWGWFELIEENEDDDLAGWYRRFVIVRMTPQQLAEEERWHKLFRENVGWHTDYRKDEPGRYKGVRAEEQWQAFYEPYEKRTLRDLSNNEVLAWFEK